MGKFNRNAGKGARRYCGRAAGSCLTLLAALLCSPALHAQQRNFLALGAISVPEFEGSADKTVAPFLVGQFDYGRSGSLRLTGLGLQYNFMDEKSPWAFGPLLSSRLKRDSDVTDEVVKKLREVEGVMEFGAFVEYRFANSFSSGDGFSVGLEAKRGKGSQAALFLNYRAPKTGDFQFSADARVVFANDEYMDTYFSIDAENRTRSGLPLYTAASGAKNASMGVTGIYGINRDWFLVGRIGVSKLLGDAKDSPIVQLRGDSSAASVGFAVGYRF
jgi:outer membrane protein